MTFSKGLNLWGKRRGDIVVGYCAAGLTKKKSFKTVHGGVSSHDRSGLLGEFPFSLLRKKLILT